MTSERGQYQLLKALKAKEGDRTKKLFQFLNEVGARALRMHIGRVLEWQNLRQINMPMKIGLLSVSVGRLN
jgi:hypothetical protein